MRIKTTVARRKVAAQFIMSSPELALLPGLFRHISVSDLDPLKYQIALRVEHRHGDKLVRVTGGYLLGGFDLAILQALELVAVGNTGHVDSDAPADVAADLRANLAATEPTVDLSYATCSVSHLLQLVGMPVNDTYVKQVGASLDRLFGVTLSVAADVSKPHISESFHLLSYTKTGEGRTNALHVALNPLLTAALTGSANQDTRMSAAELKALGTSHAARILHQRLCAIINDKGKRPFYASTLYGYLYPADKAAHDLTILRQRTELADYQAEKRQQMVLGDAVEVLATLGWTIDIETGAAEDLVMITRPAACWTYEELAARKAEAKAACQAA